MMCVWLAVGLDVLFPFDSRSVVVASFRRIEYLHCIGIFSVVAVGVVISCNAIRAGGPGEDDKQRAKLLKTFNSEFVHITPGKGKFPAAFDMGSTGGEASERPVHRVTLEHDFWMAKYEVPQDLYQAVMGENPSRWKGPRNSVEMVDLKQAVDFCRRATRLMRQAKLLKPDEEIRLPSEAEWEYCCRAGTTTVYSFGDTATRDGDTGNQASLLNEYAWHTGNAAGNDPPVGALKPNPWGLYDMHGYLWELVSDSWSDDYTGAPQDGKSRAPAQALREDGQIVMRGGSWKDRYDQLRSATRKRGANSLKDDAVGFRCVKARVNP